MKRLADIKNIEITPLAAYGLTVLAFIVAWLGTQHLSEATMARKVKAQEARLELAQLEQIQGTDIWAKRFEISEQFHENAQQKIWTGATNGVIDASLQQSLRAIAGAANMTSVQLDIAPPDTIDTVDFMQFTMSGLIPDGERVIDVLSALTKNTPHIIAMDMSVTIRQNRPSRLVVSGRVPMRVEVASAEEF